MFWKKWLKKNSENSAKDRTNQDEIDDLKSRADKINQVSPSFCTAKWLQSTVYLHNGHTHSCHHPTIHKIPMEEIKDNPSALHNTKFKKEQRKKMLEGQRPKECQYCWNIEDLGKEHISDRIYKSVDQSWSYPYLDEILKRKDSDNINPTYLEICFDSTCNFKCMYCTPDISTTWMKEVQKHGAYPTSERYGNLDWIKQTGKMPIHHSEENPYVDAFWKWWPDLYKDLVTFRITGGEPLLNVNTWKILDEVEKNPRSKFNLAINTNMGIQTRHVEKLIEKCNLIAPNIESFEIFTSCEAVGAQAEYIRHGLDYKLFMNHNDMFLSQTNEKLRLNFMITFNLLSLPSFLDFLDDIKILRKKYNKTHAFNRVPFMISYLRWPSFLSVTIAPEDIKQKYAAKFLEYAEKNAIDSNEEGFLYLEEIDQIKRLCNFMLTNGPQKDSDIPDFKKYINEYDKRKNLNFSDTFPDFLKAYIN